MDVGRKYIRLGAVILSIVFLKFHFHLFERNNYREVGLARQRSYLLIQSQESYKD